MVRQLRQRIKNNEYERLSPETNDKLITKEELKIDYLVKNPYMLRRSFAIHLLNNGEDLRSI